MAPGNQNQALQRDHFRSIVIPFVLEGALELFHLQEILLSDSIM